MYVHSHPPRRMEPLAKIVEGAVVHPRPADAWDLQISGDASGAGAVHEAEVAVEAAVAAAAAMVSPLQLATQLLGGLAFFLYGLSKLSTAIKRLAGRRLKRLIVRLTANPCIGLVSGMVVTGLSNSLTLVSVLLVGFVGSGVLQVENTIPVLMGAGIGSTLISVLVALKVTKHGLLLIAAAFYYSAYAKRRRPSSDGHGGGGGSSGGGGGGGGGDQDDVGGGGFHDTTRLDIADCVFGIGLIFYGSQVMGDTFAFLRTNATIVAFLQNLHSPFLGLLTGFVLAVLLNSSGAAMGVFLSLSEHGLLDARAGIGMVLGANVGTCMTALLAGYSQVRCVRACVRVCARDVAAGAFGCLGAITTIARERRGGGEACSCDFNLCASRAAITLACCRCACARPSLCPCVRACVRVRMRVVVSVCARVCWQGRGPLEVATSLMLARAVAAAFFVVAIAPLQAVVHAVCGVSTKADLMVLSVEPGHIHPTQLAAVDVSCQIAASHTLFNTLLAVAVLPFLRPYARAVRAVAGWILGDGVGGADGSGGGGSGGGGSGGVGAVATRRSEPPTLEITVV